MYKYEADQLPIKHAVFSDLVGGYNTIQTKDGKLMCYIID